MATVYYIRKKSFAAEPTKATPGSTGFDLYAIENQTISPGKTAKLNTGIQLEYNLSNTYPRIASRSGLALAGIIAVGGVIDADYESEIAVILLNTTDEPYEVKPGQRIAQLIFERFRDDIILKEKEDQPEQEPGTSSKHAGFGSSGH